MAHCTIDWETRSVCELRKSGSWRYSLDPSTEILCLAYRLPFWPAGKTGLWHPEFRHLGVEEGESYSDLDELFEWVRDGESIEAHNAWFERGVWGNIAVPRFGFPRIHQHQWRCSAAKAASHALPRGLDDAVKALNLSELKDSEGHGLMLKVSKPRKPLKDEVWAWQNKHNAGICKVCKGKGTYKRKPCVTCLGKGEFPVPIDQVPDMPILWHESKELFERIWAYCRQDVLAEHALSEALPDLCDAEQELYLLDQRVNERGFQLDEDAVGAALRLIKKETDTLNGQLAAVTNGVVTKGTQRQKLMTWLSDEHAVVMTDTQATTIDQYLREVVMPDPARQVLEIVRELGRSSTAKYQAMQKWKCPDGRVRGGLLYHGSSTGRWSGAGVQPHNFTRGTMKIKQDVLWEFLKTEDRSIIQSIVDDAGKPCKSVMLALSNGLRGAICATPGWQLYVADYANIEARVLLWLAGDERGLDIFRRGEDIYCDMASTIYNRAITKANAIERQLGKATILGCGYQMGASKFVETAALYGVSISEEFSKQVVNTYREKFYKVRDLWYAQEQAAMKAIQSADPVKCGRVTWMMEEQTKTLRRLTGDQTEGRFLYCVLPSGRRLAYPFPKVQYGKTSWGTFKDQLTYEGVNTYSHQWQRQKAYGGMLVENIVQAISRDLMAEAMMRCEQSNVYQPVLSVHDELIAEAIEGTGNVKEFERIMTIGSAWAKGCPIEAEGWTGFRYRK